MRICLTLGIFLLSTLLFDNSTYFLTLWLFCLLYRLLQLAPRGRKLCVISLTKVFIKLYSKGVTTREIADLIEKMYVSHYSAGQVSNISKQMVQAYHKRSLSDKFFCVYLDATYLPLRRQTFEREAVYIAIGMKQALV